MCPCNMTLAPESLSDSCRIGIHQFLVRVRAPCLCLSERGVMAGVVVVVWIGEPRSAVVYRARVRIAGRNTSVQLFWCWEMCVCCTTSPVARDRPRAGRQRIAGCQRRRAAHCAGNTQEAVRCPSYLELEWHKTVASQIRDALIEVLLPQIAPPEYAFANSMLKHHHPSGSQGWAGT